MGFVTSGSIAERLGVDRDKVAYLLRKANVKPLGRAGLVKVYPEATVDTVAELLRQSEANHPRIVA
jgi:DNA-binding transcriptional regulator LsrR (DeoR family)